MNKLLNMKQITFLDDAYIDKIVNQALDEDVGSGDISAQVLPAKFMTAQCSTRQNMVMCGQKIVDKVFKLIDPNVTIDWHVYDGKICQKNATLFNVSGNIQSILTAERTALNFIQTLASTATMAYKYSQLLLNTKCQILDTRKTIPGLRLAQKYAITCGGGTNHRVGLYDAILLKENHLAAFNHNIVEMIKSARKDFPDKSIEVEVETLQQFQDAIAAKADFIMLDNFSIKDVRNAVMYNNNQAKIEVSGNIELTDLVDLAKTGIDFISSGALTKNIDAVDLSLRYINA